DKFSGSLTSLKNCRNLEALYLTGQTEIDKSDKEKVAAESLKSLPIAKLTVFECEGTEFHQIIKSFDFGEVFQELIKAKKSDKQKNNEIVKLRNELEEFYTERISKNEEIKKVISEQMSLIEKRDIEIATLKDVFKNTKPAQNSKLLIFLAVINWLIALILAVNAV
ncbi:20809_t:CDS:2, partial [Racocetra persica]